MLYLKFIVMKNKKLNKKKKLNKTLYIKRGKDYKIKRIKI